MNEGQQQQQQEQVPLPANNQFLSYLRYYSGHRSRYGHEFLEYELDGKTGVLRYANNSNYKKDSIIKKSVCLHASVIEEIKRILIQGKVLDMDDSKWPLPDRNGRQELEVIIGNTHISFSTNKCSQISEILKSDDPEGFSDFFYLVQDLRTMILTMISLHYKIKPV